MSWEGPPPTPYGEPQQWGQGQSQGQGQAQGPGQGPGQEQYGGPYFPPYQGYPPPKRGRPSWLIGLVVVGVVVAAGVAIGVAVTSSGGGSGRPSAEGTNSSAASTPSDDATASSGTSQGSHSISVPESAGPLRLLTNDDTARRISDIESSLAGNAAYSDPQIGFYTVGSDSEYSVWMLAEDTSDLTVFQDSVSTLGVSGMARQVAQGAKMKDVTTESPGPFGGTMLCGKLTLEGSDYRVCEWVDESTFGWVYFMPSVSESDVLTYTHDLRDAAEQ